MAAIIDTDGDWKIRNKFANKIIDYVISNKNGDVVCVVELDDKTHDDKKDKDAERDKMLLACGINTIRWDSRNKPTREQIQKEFFDSRLINGEFRAK